MNADAPSFEFEIRYTHRPTDPWYHTNWDHGGKAIVIASTKEDAFKTLWTMLGDAGSHRTWTGRVLTAKQLAR
jgi:hypothetical protein